MRRRTGGKHTRVWSAVAVMITLLAGGTAGAASRGSSQPTVVDLAYKCRFPSAARPIGVQISATFPLTASVGKPIQPADAHVVVTLPQEALTDLTGLNAATVGGTASLAITVTQAGASGTAPWSGLGLPPTPIPETGDLRLTATGPMPPVTVGATGSVVFTAGEFALTLSPRKADGGTTSPSGFVIACVLDAGQQATLATVMVTGNPTAPPSPPGKTHDGGIMVKPRHRSAARLPTSPVPAWCSYNPPGTLQPIGCAYAAGYSNVTKLHGAAGIGVQNDQPVQISIAVMQVVFVCENPTLPPVVLPPHVFVCKRPNDVKHLVEVDEADQVSPPGTATFLTFGFIPTTATMTLTLAPIGNNLPAPCKAGYLTCKCSEIVVCIVSDEEANPPFAESVPATANLSLRVSDVRVNGTQLDVGAHCEATPVKLQLLGSTPGGLHPPPGSYTVSGGGILAGTASIPSFTGCGTGGDNLDPLLTAAISGNGNYVKLTQGALCDLQGDHCPPADPDRPSPPPPH